MFLINLIIFVIVLGLIILIHELGHFYFAKKAGILCHEFSIGMGPALYRKRKGETIYSVRSIPIGGYVSMAGESVSDALIRKDQVIGLKLNSDGIVTDIVLNPDLTFDIKGVVESFDLYGKEFDPLYITIDTDGDVKRFSVLRDAKYVMSEKREMWITPSEKSFENKTLGQRFMVIFAGPLMNFILAFVLFLFLSFFVLKPSLESSEINQISPGSPAETIGLESGDIVTAINGEDVNSWTDLSGIMATLTSPHATLLYTRDGIPTEVDAILVVQIQTVGLANRHADGSLYADEPIIGTPFGRAATEGGLLPGDRITSISINNESYMITDWDDIIAVFRIHPSGDVLINYLRDGEAGEATYPLISTRALGKLGYQAFIFQFGITPTESFDLGYMLGYPFRSVYQSTNQVIQTIGLLFDPLEDLGIRDLSGPVGIFGLVSNTASQGFLSLVAFTAFLSINIGLLNLLPIPALDGGRLVFLGVEAITRRPLNRRLENSINNTMFFLLLGLFVYVTFNDIMRLFGG
ncbi:MAG: RIP metalloprotease RseP [Acholeplasmataceae bacterium]